MAAQDKYTTMFWLQAVVLASSPLQLSALIVLCWQPILKVPHELSALLLQQNMSYMSPTRRLSCMAVLLSQPNLTITRRVTLYPATLPPTAEDREPHGCLAERDKLVTARPHLSDGHNWKRKICLTVIVCQWFLKDELRWNTLDWLCCCDPDWNFKRRAVAKILLCTSSRTHCTGRSLQTFLGVTIYTNSTSAFSVVHVLAAQWKTKGW